ncbi:hypothetical protein L2E82_10746 [Cichorium intybus]|uniref:Uncharacterized protein n=1 Tax=Cichorium intybus TaxID=13427 RepID=A0ACB9GC07_CICIN|nr:hypothetical protein L2E82_10746 [Cichorium intybus]
MVGKLQRPRTVLDLISSRVDSSTEMVRSKLTKLLLNLTVQRSLIPLHVLISPESNYLDLDEKLIELGSRNFFLCPKQTATAAGNDDDEGIVRFDYNLTIRLAFDFQKCIGAPIFLLTSQVGYFTDNQSVDRAYRIGQKNDLMTCVTDLKELFSLPKQGVGMSDVDYDLPFDFILFHKPRKEYLLGFGGSTPSENLPNYSKEKLRCQDRSYGIEVHCS